MKITLCNSKSEFDRAEDFLDQQPVPSPPVELQFRFPKGLKYYLDQFSQEHDTWILETDSDNKNNAMSAGSIIYKERMIEGVQQKIALTSFMKIKPDAKSTLLWAKHMLPEMHNRLKEKNCEYIFSFVFESLRKQIRDFRKAVKLKDTMPRYFLIRKVSLILIHGRLPWLSHALKSISIRKAEISDSKKILDFLTAQQELKKIKKSWTEEEIQKIITKQKAPRSREHFYIGLDLNQNVVGTFLPIEINDVREDLVTSATPETFSYFQFQRILSFVGLTNKPPQLKKPFKHLYLSQIDATNPDVFESLLRFVYKTLRHKNEVISYTHYSGNLISKPPTSFLAGALPMDLYLILPQDKNPPEFLKSYWMAPTPDLECILF